MFSRLASRSARIIPVLHLEATSNKMIVVLPARANSSLNKQLENWEKARQLYYGPERDLKNFPVEKQPVYPPPVRLGFIPETWFQFFYEKTGVTGPYIFGAGLLTYIWSKEIWVMEHGFTEFLTFWIAIWILVKKFGPATKQYLEAEHERFLHKCWHGPLEKVLQDGKANIDALEKVVWQEEGQKHLFEAKRENVDLQLEAVYRQRLEAAHQAVKKRLDYQVELENTKRRFEQQHMVNWIVNSVVKGITPQQEKDSLNKCISDLKNLSQKHAASI